MKWFVKFVQKWNLTSSSQKRHGRVMNTGENETWTRLIRGRALIVMLQYLNFITPSL